MNTVELKLYKNQGLIGHCQLTYTAKNPEGQRLTYCLQDRGERWEPRVALFRCTQDGEPMYETSFKRFRAQFERPSPHECDSEYASELKRVCNQWISEYERGV